MSSHEQLEWQNKWFKAQQQPVITATVLIWSLLKCSSKAASFIHRQTQTYSDSWTWAHNCSFTAVYDNSCNNAALFNNSTTCVVYENVYLWNKHQLWGERRRSCAVFENTDTDLREHGQFFGKVHNSCDGRGDDLGELTEGLQVDFVIVWCGGWRLPDVFWLKNKTI